MVTWRPKHEASAKLEPKVAPLPRTAVEQDPSVRFSHRKQQQEKMLKMRAMRALLQMILRQRPLQEGQAAAAAIVEMGALWSKWLSVFTSLKTNQLRLKQLLRL
jgi:hypothetical protein